MQCLKPQQLGVTSRTQTLSRTAPPAISKSSAAGRPAGSIQVSALPIQHSLHAAQLTNSSTSSTAQSSVVSRLWRGALAVPLMAAGLSLTLALAPVQAEAAQFSKLADIVRPGLGFVDTNKDGFVTEDEMLATSKQVAEDVEFTPPSHEQLLATLRLFDLNGDGRTSLDEMLTAFALDGAVDEEGAQYGEPQVNADVAAVFDADGDGLVDEDEWRAALGDLGPSGDGLKEYIFRRVDAIAGPEETPGKLEIRELGSGLVLVRTAIMGF